MKDFGIQIKDGGTYQITSAQSNNLFVASGFSSDSKVVLPFTRINSALSQYTKGEYIWISNMGDPETSPDLEVINGVFKRPYLEVGKEFEPIERVIIGHGETFLFVVPESNTSLIYFVKTASGNYVDTTQFAEKDYVNEQIKAMMPEEIDTSLFADKTYVDAQAAQVDKSGKAYTDEKVASANKNTSRDVDSKISTASAAMDIKMDTAQKDTKQAAVDAAKDTAKKEIEAYKASQPAPTTPSPSPVVNTLPNSGSASAPTEVQPKPNEKIIVAQGYYTFKINQSTFKAGDFFEIYLMSPGSLSSGILTSINLSSDGSIISGGTGASKVDVKSKCNIKVTCITTGKAFALEYSNNDSTPFTLTKLLGGLLGSLGL